MQRLIIVLFITTLLPLSVLGQVNEKTIEPNLNPQSSTDVSYADSLAGKYDLPLTVIAPELFDYSDSDQMQQVLDLVNNTTPYTEEQLNYQLSQVYTLQAQYLASINSDQETAEKILTEALTNAQQMTRRRGVLENDRFRKLYASLLTEYDHSIGSADSLALPNGEIYNYRSDLFAALDEPLLEDVNLPELPSIETEFNMEVNRLVEQNMEFLLRDPNRALNQWLSRMETYFPMVEQILAEEGVPDELKYLAMIESGLNPRAKSWARANGMWQFISATGRYYGLQVNSWQDERLDPEKSTRAAARHLRDLYELFDNDWQLALAGYNCSPSRIKRAIRRVKRQGVEKPTFWDIYQYIPRETRGYVPMFIATSLIVSNQEIFKLDPVTPGPRYEYDFVPVPGMISLQTVADLTGTDIATIKALNPEIRRSFTPPVSKGTYQIRVPIGTGDQFITGWSQLSEEKRRPRTQRNYRVKSGDTLGAIARQFGVSVRDLRSANGIRGSIIRRNQNLVIPIEQYSNDAVAELPSSAKSVQVIYGNPIVHPIRIAASSAPNASAARQVTTNTTATTNTSTTNTVTPTIQVVANRTKQAASQQRQRQTQPAPTPTGTRVRYRVRSGDTVGEIAERYGVSARRVRSWNRIRGNRIRVGQTLTIYTTKSRAESDVQPTRRSLDQQTSTPTSHPVGSAYTVRRGDSLDKIARKYGVSIENLKRWNNLRSNTIQPGDRMKVSE